MTNKEFVNVEIEPIRNTSFIEALAKLSNVENPTPLNSKEINRLEIREKLLISGIKIDLIENNLELQESIKHPQLRYAYQGKGTAVIAVLGSLDNYNDFFDWAMKESKNEPTAYGGIESSKCRGLMQFLGETIALASGQLTPEKYCQKINWRVGKKYQKNSEIAKKFNLPTDKKGLQELEETLSIPKGSAIKAFEFILSLNK